MVRTRSLVAEAMRVASASSGKIDLRTFTALMLDRELTVTKKSSSRLLAGATDDDANAKAPVQTETISAAAASASSAT